MVNMKSWILIFLNIMRFYHVGLHAGFVSKNQVS